MVSLIEVVLLAVFKSGDASVEHGWMSEDRRVVWD